MSLELNMNAGEAKIIKIICQQGGLTQVYGKFAHWFGLGRPVLKTRETAHKLYQHAPINYIAFTVAEQRDCILQKIHLITLKTDENHSVIKDGHAPVYHLSC